MNNNFSIVIICKNEKDNIERVLQSLAGVTDDKYLLVIEASDPRFDLEEVRQSFSQLGAKRTEVLEA